MNFIPHVFIGIGRDGHFFTLRQTYQRVIGYQGHIQRVVSEHVKNLSQDADEAFKAAQEYASERGMILKTKREELPDNLEEIFRRTREQREAARREAEQDREDRRKAYEEAKLARRKETEGKILSGIIPFGQHAGKNMSDVRDYVKWIYDRRDEFEQGSVLEFFCIVVERDFADLLKSEYVDAYLDYPTGKRVEIKGVVKRVFSFQSDFGVVRYVTILADNGCQVLAKGKWYTEEGKRVRIMGTIKEKSEYKGQKQTVINRVKELQS